MAGKRPPIIPFAADANLTKLTGADVRARLANKPTLSESLNIPSPGGNAASGLKPLSMPDGTKFELSLAKIKPYDRNPRRAANAAFDEIKRSLKATGPTSLELWVTQRPGDESYMPYRGGNTRLSAIQALAQEGDARWARLIVTHKQWVSEADTLAQHLIENNNRADMTFWDKACAYLVDMRQEVERELGGAEISLRRLEEEFSRRGIGVKKSLLSLFQFAVQRLSASGRYLSATQVIQMQPAINQMARLAEKFGIDDEAFQALLNGVCTALRPADPADPDANKEEGSLRAAELIPALEAAMSAQLEASLPEVRRWLDTLERFPDMTLEDLRNGPGSAPPERSRPDARSSATPGTALPASGPAEAGEGASSERPSQEAGPNPVDQSGVAMKASSPAPTAAYLASSSSTPIEAVITFAEAACVRDCLRLHEPAKTGFYMEAPVSAIDVDVACQDTSHRVIAWQLLAALSGQWIEAEARRLPTDSVWRRMRLNEGGLDPDTLSLYVQDQLLADVGSQAMYGAEDLGWGVLIPVNWMMNLLHDPACGAALANLFTHFPKVSK